MRVYGEGEKGRGMVVAGGRRYIHVYIQICSLIFPMVTFYLFAAVQQHWRLEYCSPLHSAVVLWLLAST